MRLEPHPSPPAFPPTHRYLATAAAASTASGGCGCGCGCVCVCGCVRVRGHGRGRRGRVRGRGAGGRGTGGGVFLGRRLQWLSMSKSMLMCLLDVCTHINKVT